jgi:membrane peptidoglycan carboxypeptidase
VSSKADDFDVRYRDAGEAGGLKHGRAGAGGGYSYAGNIDYDLGYDANGWDTNGFRSPETGYSPEAGYLDSHESGPARGADRGLGGVGVAARPDDDRAPGGRREGGHARPAGTHEVPAHGVPAHEAPEYEAPAHEAWLADPYRSATADTRDVGPLSRVPQSSGRSDLRRPGEAPPRRRAAGSGGPRGPRGPAGPRRPAGPDGLRGPGRRGRTRTQVKVKGSWWRHWTLRKVLGVLLACIGGVVVIGAVVVAIAYEDTPVPTEAMAATSFTQSVVYSGNGTLIGRFGTTNRQELSYNQIPQRVINAVLAAEDRNFFHEGGISPEGIVRAAYEDTKGNDGSVQGGSTITQQFVRNYYSGIGTEQTFSRKIKEIFVAMKVSKEKSKQWILENYLNTIYLGDGAYGIGAAAETYFGEPVSKVTVAQAAVLGALIQQPSTYPLPQYRPELEARWQYVLGGMVTMGNLTAEQAATMKFPKLGDYVPQTVGSDVWDPYVLDVVYNELTDVYHFTQSQIDNGGYVIKTSISDSKMRELYEAVQQNEVEMAQGGVALPTDAHVGAVLENPANGAIEAMYPGPGYPGSNYVDYYGSTHKMSVKECNVLDCEVNMAVYNREQVGSSFKPYVLATAVSQGMNVQTSTLDGYDPLWIPPDTQPDTYATSTEPADAYQWYKVTNDSPAEDGPFTPQLAMAESINTAYTDLWHKVTGAAVAKMAGLFGVDTNAACITASCGKGKDMIPAMEDEAGIALGQASLTVGEQATMLATIDDNGVYHAAHVITSITQNSVPTPITVISYPVFSSDSALNAEEATQVQYAMSEDTAAYGTAPTAGLSNGQEIIAKTGTTNTAQSAFFIGAIPSQALAVGIFTDKSDESLPADLGGNSQGGYGGTWPASIWHTYAENEFVPLGIEPFTTPVFTGSTWNMVPPNLRVVPHKKTAKKHGRSGYPTGTGNGSGNPSPYPTYSCDPSVVTCNSGGKTQSTNAAKAGGAVGGIFAGLPATCLWVRRRMRRRGPKRG